MGSFGARRGVLDEPGGRPGGQFATEKIVGKLRETMKNRKGESALAANMKGWLRLREKFWIPQGRHVVSHEHKIILGISPKAGCTVATNMFFDYVGLLGEARHFDPWIHRYRIHYRKRQKVSVKNFSSGDYFSFKVVRSPYTRAVSSYTHTIHTWINKGEMLRSLGLERPGQLSFRQFLRFMRRTNMARANRHQGLQTLALEGGNIKYDYILKLEILNKGLDEIREKFGIDLRLKECTNRSAHHTKKGDSVGSCVADVEYDDLPKDDRGVLKQPPYTEFFNQETKDLVEEIYRIDINNYGYEFPF